MERKKGESNMESNIFRKIMVATEGSELVRKAVDSAIETAKLCKAKLYAVYVLSLEGYSITPSRDTEWEKAMKEQLMEVLWMKLSTLQIKMTLILSLWVHKGKM